MWLDVVDAPVSISASFELYEDKTDASGIVQDFCKLITEFE